MGLGFVVLVNAGMPFMAHAQTSPEETAVVIPGGGYPVAVTGNAYEEVAKKFKGFFNTLTVGGITALMNTLQVFHQRIAYDMAQRILTGDSGQYPLFWEDNYDEYFKKVAEDAGNEFISTINSDVLQQYGIDLCAPTNPFKTQVSLSMQQFTPPAMLKATCTAAQIGAAHEEAFGVVNDEDVLNKYVSAQFDTRANQMSVGIETHNKYIDIKQEALKAAELDRQETQGLKQVQDAISGKIRTPSQAVKDTFAEANLLKQANKGMELNYLTLAGNAFEIGFTQLAIITVATFVNTLAAGAMQKLFNGLAGSSLDVRELDLASPEAVANRNVANAQILFADLLTPNLITNDQRDFVTELSTCPEPRGLFSCAMDDAFVAALRTVGETGAYTVGRASHVVLNGDPPSNPAFLHKDWELIPESDVKENGDSTCYQRAYCATNLAKLRYARIIPAGWEMAANSPFNKKKNGRYVTLEEVIRGFSVCNEEGKGDSTHPWCKLIDPNWVLSAPPFQCRVKGGGDTVVPGTTVRLEECADAVSCLGRNDQGKCTQGYGYCLAEKPVWRFPADACLERFASCRTYTDRSGQQVSYLRNTIDYGSCSADNVGCLWYATERAISSDGKETWTGDAASGTRIYMDANVKPCSGSADGCTKMYEVRLGSPALNLVENSSFEQTRSDDATKPTGWDITGADVSLSDEAAINGGRSLLVNGASSNATLSEVIRMEPVRNFTLTMYARAAVGNAPADVSLELALRTQNATPVTATNAFRSSGCTVNTGSSVGFTQTLTANDPVTWVRYACSFVSNQDVHNAVLTIHGSNMLVDAVQLEEGEKSTSFVEGIASGLTEAYLKVPPEEFACTGEKTDAPSCAKYARVCRASDTGCQGYRDISTPNAPEIPASLSANDVCPSTCVGYAEYRKQPSAFDLGRNADARLDDPQDDTSATFIPALAQQCSLADVGCEEFTNVEAQNQGGEQTAHFNYVRACEKPSENSETYFTWEGSDVTGYQLRTWSLVHDPSQAPFAPKVLQKTGPDGVLKDVTACTAQTWQTGADPDCRQFFNADGAVFYAYFSQTVLSSASCLDYRKNGSDAADCEKTGGTFTPVTGECIYKILPKESRVCRSANTGCRAYLGTTARNTSIVYEEGFRANAALVQPFTAGERSNESILVGDQSLKVTGSGQTLETATVFPSTPNQLYRLSFWAKTTSASQPTATVLVDGTAVGTFTLNVDWQRYEIGPFAASAPPTSTLSFAGLANATYLDEIRVEQLRDVSYIVKNSWTIPQECDATPEGLPQPQAMLGCRAYRDRNGTNVTVRQFGQLCREEAIGCKAFIDTRNSDSPYVQRFEVAGNNQNLKVTPEARASEDKYVGSTMTTRQADRYVYLIDEPSARCTKENMSCRAFGKPVYTQDQTALASPEASAYETVYFMDDITQYVDGAGEPNVLCRKSELFCDEFKSGKTVAYFRNPLKHTCEWKDKVLLKASSTAGIPFDGEYSGWFRAGTEIPCYPGQLSSGNTYLDQNSGDPGYTGWVGNCPVEQSECTEFRDPNDTSDPLHPTGKPYYFIKNSRLDLKSCGGKIDLLSGCVLFRDLSDPRNRYNTVATYAKSKAEGDTPQTPIDCVTDPDNAYCQGAGRCVGVAVDPRCEYRDGPDADSIPDQYYCAHIASTFSDTVVKNFVSTHQGASCNSDAECTDQDPEHAIAGTCEINNANAVLKVKLDRDCAQWLGCSSAETVYDPAQGKYVDLCTDVAVCDATKGSTSGAFCSHYVDRKTDPVLTTGIFFDRNTYMNRRVGFGELDYSGYAIPNRFQAADIENRNVGKELFERMPDLANKFATDYRLVAAVPESTGLIQFGVVDNLYPNLSLCRHTATGRVGYQYPFAAAAPNRVCYFAIDALSTQSAAVEIQGAQSVDPRNIQALADVLRQTADAKNDVVLQSSLPPAECKAYPESDAPFPGLYVKEWDYTVTPFKPKSYVEGYSGVNTCEYGEDCACSYRKVRYGTQITKYVSPFGQAPPAGICSGGLKDGESCVPGQEQNTNSNDILGAFAATPGQDPGCPGGGRCLDISSVTLVRGQFGQCLQRDYSRTVAGDPGRHPCLIWSPNPILSGSYDTNHFIPEAGYNPPVNSGEYYCLSYADQPIDTVWQAESHTLWSDARERTKGSTDGANTGENPFLLLPGKLSKFNYDRGYIAGKCPTTADVCSNLIQGVSVEGDCNCWDGGDKDGNDEYPGTMRDLSEAVRQNPVAVQKWIDSEFPATPGPSVDEILVPNNPRALINFTRWQNLGSSIDGLPPEQAGDQGKWCAQIAAWKDQDELQAGDVASPGIGPQEQAPDMDLNLGRWIQTGNGIGRTYAEYFFPARPQGVYKWLNNNEKLPVENASELLRSYKESMLERNFAEFRFYTSNDPYLAACKLPKYYVDGVDVNNFADPDEVFNASKQIYSEFNRNFDGVLNRSKELIVKDDNGRPVKEKCSGLNEMNKWYPDGAPDYADQDGRCYMKAWELNYRMDGTPKFDWLKAESGTSLYERYDRAYFRERTCSKSGFAIRAVFENTSKTQNSISIDDVQDSQLAGPWEFVGFWVTACTAGTDHGAFMYLGMRVKHADICRDIAQTISPYSRESAAFADRVWRNGTFSIPQLGFTYSSTYGPFGSALVNGIPGLEPLFQTGGPVEGYSLLKPPVFLGSGQTYVTMKESPIQRWAHLSNVFARIYRVYKYYDQGIDTNGYACFRDAGNTFTGVACSPDMPADQIDQYCGGKGVCDTKAVTATVKNNVFRCNGLSGVNAGLTCGGSFEMASLDPVCHNAAMKNVGNGVYEPQLTSCNLRAGWVANDPTCSSGQYLNPTDHLCYNAKTAHEKWNAFGCGNAAVVPGSACAEPSQTSKDCPMKVENVQCVPDDVGPMAGHCGGGYEHARCDTGADCVFTAAQWWGAYDNGKLVTDAKTYNRAQVENAVIANTDLVSALEVSSMYHGLKLAGTQWYPTVSPPNPADPDQSILPTFVTDVSESAYALPFPRTGSNTSMSTIGRDMFERDCNLGSGLCKTNTHYETSNGGTVYALKHGEFAPFAALFRWGAVTRLATNSALLKRWPSPHTVAEVQTGVGSLTPTDKQVYVIPGLCEGAKGASQDPSKYVFEQSGITPTPANIQQFVQGRSLSMGQMFSSSTPAYGNAAWALEVGRCDGGQNDGAFCSSNAPGNFCQQGANSNSSCLPVTTSFAADGTPVPRSPACSVQGFAGDPRTTDMDQDANACTRNAGYKPITSVCGNSANNEKCLTYYAITGSDSDVQASLSQKQSPAPTDVTAGFHSPIFLGLQGGSPADYQYISYYAPRPPTIAAPDFSRTCQTPGSCPISTVGTFSVEGQTSGPVSYAGGQALTNLRFYGWAAQDQTPLKQVNVDWGDGNVTTIDHARLKNKKPFCNVSNECELVPGLTCTTDSDCPAGAGKCAPRGSCAQSPGTSCTRDTECSAIRPGDKCNIRQFFGNSSDACEANYFDFMHAYICDADALPSCDQNTQSNGTNADLRCERMPSKICTALSQNSSECGGDACVAGLAPPGGCFDRNKNVCVFTPRVLLKDSFNWCTGECRSVRVGNDWIDGPGAKVRHVYGGCWDGTETKKNSDPDRVIMSEGVNNTDECSLDTNVGVYTRPWIVYPGAVEIGTIK